MRVTALGEVNPLFDAVTLTNTLVPVMEAAPAGTLTDQVAGSAEVDVAVRSVVPTATVTLTPASEPVAPVIANPAAFSAMFTTLSVAIASSVSARVSCTVTVNSAVASL